MSQNILFFISNKYIIRDKLFNYKNKLCQNIFIKLVIFIASFTFIYLYYFKQFENFKKIIIYSFYNVNK